MIQVDGSRGARVSSFRQQLVSEDWPRSPSGNPAPSSPPPGLCSILVLSSSSDLSSARIGTATRPHDKGALLIIGDSVLSQVMMAKMHSGPRRHEASSSGTRARSLGGPVIIDDIVEACM